MQKETKHPIAELVEALEDLDFKFEQVRYAEKAFAEAKAKFLGAKRRAEQAYQPAFVVAEQMGEQLGNHFQRSKSLITFDDDCGVTVVEFDCQYTFQLRQWLEPKVETTDTHDEV
ncbi:hypothetical protein [Metapseudomonas otitidis]|uniref:hypothetical protein n=1 Tax=Metapseudomonas otitidis TaxID=319939 RepID=UPI0028111BE1|nr:hypothetical protein [Pseudomonas otitidis]WMR35711.1 hypothetical protein QT513_13550 [Pseudomonas otitidis]